MSATFIKCLTNIKDLPIGNKPHVAIVGRSNVGKSSLINHLVMQKGLARVGASPGRTQTINLFEIDKRYFLVDLPGYGFAKMSKNKRSGFIDMISHYLDRAPDLKLVLLIVDASIPPTDLDHEMLVFLQASGIPTVVVLNKIDKLSKNQLLKEAFPSQTIDKYASTKDSISALEPNQLVIIAIPDHLHYEIIIEALNANQNVFCVKPLVLSYAQALEIKKLSDEKGLWVGIDYHKRFDNR